MTILCSYGVLIYIFTLSIHQTISFGHFTSTDYGYSTCSSSTRLSQSSKEGDHQDFHLEEFKSSSGQLTKKIFIRDDGVCVSSHTSDDRSYHPRHKLAVIVNNGLHTMRKTFLPVGFPQSVPKEYITYQKWHLIQDSCSYLRGILSTRAILEGFGVGRSDITASTAAVQWILRDGASMLGGLLFTTYSSVNFGQNVKSWRLFADLINNFGITLDMIAPLYRQYFLPIICIASICKSLCGVAAGAAGAAISEHWGRQGNIADVMSKNGAQHTVINLLGLAISVPFAEFANRSPIRLAWLYVGLTAVHIFSNIKAMRALALRSLNLSRYFLIMKILWNNDFSININDQAAADVTSAFQRRLLDVSNQLSLQSIANHEPLFRPILTDTTSSYKASQIQYWCSPSVAIENCRMPSSTIRDIFNIYTEKMFTILPSSNDRSAKVFVCLKQGFNPLDQAEALFEAHIVQRLLLSDRDTVAVLLDSTKTMQRSRRFSDAVFHIFWAHLASLDWDVQRLQLQIKECHTYSTICKNKKLGLSSL